MPEHQGPLPDVLRDFQPDERQAREAQMLAAVLRGYALNALYGRGPVAHDIRGKSRPELYGYLPTPAEHVKGRISYLRDTFGPSIEEFLSFESVDYGHHEDATHRINLLVISIHMFAAEFEGLERKNALLGWLTQKDMQLDDLDPLEYLGTVQNMSSTLLLDSAMRKIPSHSHGCATDERAMRLVIAHQNFCANVEAEYEDFKPRA